ncbi:MAG: S41 family peptidase [Bacteriovorax sp.]|jgi:hypothetical protein
MKMSKSFLLLLALSTAISAQAVQAGLLKHSAKKLSVEGLRDVYSGVRFHYYDSKERLTIVQDFLRTVELDYALLPLKTKRIGLDFNKLKAEAIDRESKEKNILITDANRTDQDERNRISFLQAKSNMEFLDRMQALVAQFQDTHFGIQEKISRPVVYTGIRLYRIDGKVVVGGIEKKLMSLASKLTGNDFSSIAVGDEVLSVNGKNVEERVSELKKFIGSSTDEFGDYQAVRSLTIRNHNYEERNTVTIKFKKAGLFKLPLFANITKDSTPRMDAMTFFAKLGIPSDASTIGLNYDKATKQWLDGAISFEGYAPTKLHLNLKGLLEMTGDDGSPALRSGYYIKDGKAYGVLQILTFSTKNVKTGDVTMSYLDGIRSFISELKENQLPLILDLRLNGGGNANFPAAVLSILAKENVTYPGPTRGYRMTSYIRQLEESRNYQEIAGEDQSNGLTLDELQDLLQKTVDEKRELTPMMSFQNIKVDEKIKGFNNKIVALVTANCISACDMMSYLLKSSKRATIIGTHSNGTGAGYSSSSELNTKWEDPFKVLETNVPNFLFGIPGESAETTVFDENSAEKMCSENRPTFADIPYAASMLDVAKNNNGWLQKAAQVLDTLK